MKLLRAETAAGRRALEDVLGRRGKRSAAAERDVRPIVDDVRRNGLGAVARWVRRFDGVSLTPRALLVDPRAGAPPAVDATFARAFRLAVRRVTAYHRHQIVSGFRYTDSAGVTFTERAVPLESAGVYVPGGRAFYPSSLVMGVVPARVAGVPRVVVATPPRAWAASAELRWAAREMGVDRVLLAGGAAGIAGLVHVLDAVKVVGPGNRWVAAAKQAVSSVVSIDLPAGPSEVLVLATAGARPPLVAADLLAQAEHDPDAVCLLLTTSRRLAESVLGEVAAQLPKLATRATARRSLARNGLALVCRSLAEAVAIARRVAAEHVQAMGGAAEAAAPELAETAGAVFVGDATPTALGDYVAGPNHVLPTGGAARGFSGLSTRDFVRWSRSLRASGAAARRLAGSAAVLARFEGLDGHARALERRIS